MYVRVAGALPLQYETCPAGTIDVLKQKMFHYFGVTCLKDMLSHFFPTIKKPFFSRFALNVVEGISKMLSWRLLLYVAVLMM